MSTPELSPRESKDVELLAAILDASPDPIVSQDLNGLVISWNRAAGDCFGYSAQEVLGRPLNRLAPHFAPAELSRLVRHLRDDARPLDCETAIRLKNGEIRSVLLTVSLLRSAAGGEIIGTSMRVRDRGEAIETGADLVHLNTELLQSEHRFRVLSETFADILWSTDNPGLLPRYFSPQFRQYTGIAPDVLSHHAFLDLLHPDDRPSVEASWQEAMAAEQRFQIEFRLRRSDGKYRWFVSRGLPILDGEGNVAHWIGICTDIHLLKRGEEALRRSNRELKQFAYAAAHDLQEPLRNVATSIGMLRRHYGPDLDPGGLEWIEASIEGAQRLYAMVKDLLTFSTILDDEAAPSAEDELISGRAALEAALVELSAEIASTAPDIRIGPLPQLAVKRSHAIQLFQNIIGNSLKYRRAEVRLTLEVSAVPSGIDWKLSVKDNGIGFNPVYATRIFDVFSRLHTREQYSGNGIGLAICDRIVAHYGGRIWAESLPGTGTTLCFTLPGSPGTADMPAHS